MKFSKLEQEEIKKICEWAKTPDIFWGISHYLSHYGLQDGTGIFSFPNENLILCFDTEMFDNDNFYPNGGNAIKKTVFILNFILKLERLNYVTLVPEKGVEFLYSFKGHVYIKNIEKNEFDYYFSYLNDKVNSTKAKLIYKDNVIIDTETKKQIYFCYPIQFEFDSYRLLSSFMMVNQELFELVSNDFKTYEDIQLEEAQNQTKIAHESLEEARKQTESASASLAEAQKQTGKAKTQTNLSITAVVLSVFAIIASIFVPRFTPSTLDQKQFDTIQIKQDELIKTLNEIKISQIDNDSLIKELNLANQSIDEISNTLKEVKELNSKRK